MGKIFSEAMTVLTSVSVGGLVLLLLIALLFFRELQTFRPAGSGSRLQGLSSLLIPVLSVLVGLILLVKVLK